ncbi:hypothetical protein PPERSA_12293 [Pseudocohnilembus persalinus]|uniref:Uncharacterized protein n=1 Tax=Pseudocohnilembus persalinus TaxID=266149 RepID=A0A0V0R4Z1_PSEPJ|nr:hypothetical protein PPERSA_12293 [Pseudocohnilembus persalinus]|eukprot:KRX09550.1 hypothetical protein PPERSA_12293 [Pseudocohnilembus persalinus]
MPCRGSHTQQFLSCDLYQIKAENQDQNSNHMKTYHHTTNLQVKNNLGYYKDGEYYFNDKNEENNYKQSDEFKQYEKEKYDKQNKDENNLTLVQTLYKKNITNQINTAFGPHINKWQNEVLNQIHVAFNKKLILLGYSGEIITLNIFMENKNSIKKSVFHEIMDIGSTLFILLAFIITFLSAKTIFGNLDDVENFNAAQIITGDNEDEDDEDDEEQESDQEQILFEV